MRAWTRRDFLLTIAAVRAADAGSSLWERLSVITDEVATSPAEAISFARQYGLRWVELRGVPGSNRMYYALPLEELQQTARELEDHGLRVSFLNTDLLKGWLPGTTALRPEWQRPADEQRFARRFDDLERALEAAHALRVDKIRVFTFRRTAEPEAVLPRVAEILDELAEQAAKARVRLLVENEGSCNVATCRELARLMSLIRSPWIGINWDPFNGRAYGERPWPDGYALLPKNRIGNVQMKGRSILPGPEQLDWPAIFRRLLQDGYTGCFGLETHTREDRIGNSHRSMQILQAWIRES